MQKNILEVRGLVEDNKKDNSGVSFTLNSGQALALYGPNIQTKSNLLKKMIGLYPFERGEVFIDGLSVKKNLYEIKKLTAYVPQKGALDLELTCFENIYIYARANGVNSKRAKTLSYDALRKVHLEDYADKFPRDLKIEQKNLLSIIKATVHSPKVIFIEEPFLNMESKNFQKVKNLLNFIKSLNISVVITTRRFSEIQDMLDKVIFFSESEIICEGEPKSLIKRYIGHQIIQYQVTPEEITYFVSKIKNQLNYKVIDNKICVYLSEHQDPQEIFKIISSEHMVLRKPHLEDVYTHVYNSVTGESAL
ncbi:MAG: ABC transporter ATP-binding protein [Bdellovibrionales bacterium]|nr:ABC transporter ATP-binding protein [Bdellovibrionales bacterium]